MVFLQSPISICVVTGLGRHVDIDVMPSIVFSIVRLSSYRIFIVLLSKQPVVPQDNIWFALSRRILPL